MEYVVISPDGFSISRDGIYKSIEDAKIALNDWKKNYERQGYYSSNNYGRIPLNELEGYCKITILK
jgi:hypothetical protein